MIDFSGSVGFRATKGSCTGTPATIERSTDGGATWQNVSPTDITIHEVDSLTVVDDSHVDLLAKYGDACTTSAISSFTQGEFWQAYPDRTSTVPAADSPTTSPLPGVYAVASADNGTELLARFGVTSCPGVALQSAASLSAASGETTRGCLATVTTPTPLALSVNGTTLWLWASGTTYISTDAGATWKQAA